MAKYYFLATALPSLEIGVEPAISQREFEILLENNLSDKDLKKTSRIRLFYDIHNIRAMWRGEPLDPWGTLSQGELEEDLLTRGGRLPKFVYALLEEHESLEERLRYFPTLFIRFYEITAKHATGFLGSYALFERNLRLALLGYRVRRLGRDLLRELQFEDPEEDLVAQLIAQKDAPQYVPPMGFEDLKPVIDLYYEKPLELQQALYEYRFNKLESMLGSDVFSMDYILIYMIKFIMVSKWLLLDKEKGLQIVDKIVKGIA